MGNVLSSKYTYEETTLDLGPEAGKWRGTLVDGKVKRFLGIPYALSPTGNYRWRRPRPLPESYTYSSRMRESEETGSSKEETHQPFDATQFGAVCPQIPFPGAPPSKMEYGEDCLSVNIWMPVGEAPKDGWPVLVWFHGESFLMRIAVLDLDVVMGLVQAGLGRSIRSSSGRGRTLGRKMMAECLYVEHLHRRMDLTGDWITREATGHSRVHWKGAHHRAEWKCVREYVWG